MRKLFPLVFLFLSPYTHAADCKAPITIPGSSSGMIFNGSDDQLPIGECSSFIFSINEKILKKPRDIVDAEDKIITAMPRWMYRAIYDSRGDFRCVVKVNDMDYFSVLIDYYIEKWNNAGLNAEALKGSSEFLDEDFPSRLQELICKRIKQNSKDAEP